MGIVEKAKAENKVIHAYYHDVWFTPEGLEKKQRQGNRRSDGRKGGIL